MKRSAVNASMPVAGQGFLGFVSFLLSQACTEPMIYL